MSTTTCVTVNCKVYFNNHALRVTNPATGRIVEIDLNRVRQADITDDESMTMNNIMDDGVPNRELSQDLTCEEMKRLVSVLRKTGGAVREPAPATVAVPVQVIQKRDQLRETIVQFETRKETYTAKGIDQAERQYNALATISGGPTRRYTTLQYDIPDHLGRECPNPSGILWRNGFFRDQLSVWIGPVECLDNPAMRELFALWGRHGIKFRTIRFADDENEQIHKIAQEALRKHLIDLHTSLIQCIASADKTLEEATAAAESDEKGPPAALAPRYSERLEDRRDNGVRAILKKKVDEFLGAVKCAEHYEETEDVQQLFEGLRLAIRSQAGLFNAAMQAKGSKPAVSV